MKIGRHHEGPQQAIQPARQFEIAVTEQDDGQTDEHGDDQQYHGHPGHQYQRQ